jgi:osmotically-inducible protein OsmY
VFRFFLFFLLSLRLYPGFGLLEAADPDGVIQRRLQLRMARSSLRHDTVSIRVAGGVATLEGFVENSQRKGLATRFARESGASEVVNLLRINDGRPRQPLKVVRVLP